MTSVLVIADTHLPKRARDLPAEVWERVDAADVVIHAGDWVDESLLDTYLDTVAELELFFRTVYKPYGWLSAAQWRRLTETSTRRLPDGRVTPHYDPAMVRQFTAHDNDYLIWPHYDAIDVPVLCLRGAESDLVRPETVAAMQTRGPGILGLLDVLEVPDCGHAPALNVPAHLLPIEIFLRGASR